MPAQQISHRRGASRSRWIALGLGGFAGLVLIAGLGLALEQIHAIGFFFERNYNEGWNVYNLERLIARETIYDDNYWRVNNYPPLSFVVSAGVNYLVRDPLLSGRIVALAGFLALGPLAGMATRRLGGSRADALFGAGCALGFCYLMAPNWVAVDDPQTLGEALMVGALVAYLGGPGVPRNLVLAAFLVMAAGFTKHNLVAIPLAIALDLALRSPRRLAFWLAYCAGFAAAFLLATYAIAGGSFIEHLLSPRVFIWYNVNYHLMKFLRLFKFPLVVVVLCSGWLLPRERRVLAFYGVLAVAAGAFLSGVEGTSYNMFQDAAVWLGIACGVVFAELRKRVAGEGMERRLWAKLVFALAIFLAAQPVATRAPIAFGNVAHLGASLAADRASEQSFAEDAAFIAAAKGPAICEDLLLCYKAGQPFSLDPFNSRQYMIAGRLEENALIYRIAAQEFAVIQLRADVCDDPQSAQCHILHYPRKFNRFTDGVLYAVDANYRIARKSEFGVFYVPK